MATVIKTRKLVANPYRTRKRARKRNAKRNARGGAGHRTRRKMTAKQIRFFGTKAQKAALRRKRRGKASASHRKRTMRARTRVRANPVTAAPRKRRSRRKMARRRKRTSNPALIVTLGAVNPRRRKTVARHRRKRAVNPKRRRRSRRNTTRVVVTAPRRHNRRRYSRRTRRANPRHLSRRRRRRNPQLSFGAGHSFKSTIKAVGGGLVGVAAAKFVPTMLPSSLVSSNLMRTVTTGVSAFISGWLLGKVDKEFGDAVLFGGLMQTGSTALNAFLPSVAGALGISGLGAFADAMFPVPQNPIMAGVSVPAPVTRVNTSGIGRAFGSAF